MTRQIQIKEANITSPAKLTSSVTNEAAKADSRLIGEGRDFERIRRITGYLVGTIDRWNNAKRAEEHDRVKHNF